MQLEGTPLAGRAAVTEARFSSLMVRGVYEAVQAAGGDSARLFASAHLDLPTVDARGWVSLEDFDRLLCNAVEEAKDPSFGLHWAERSPMLQLDMPMVLISSAPTLRDTMHAVVQAQLLMTNREQCWFREAPRHSVIAYDLASTSATGKRVLTELGLGGTVRIFRYRGLQRSIRRINVRYAAPANAAEYERCLEVPVFFSQPQTSIEFASSALTHKHELGNEARHHQAREHAARLRQHVLAEVSWEDKLESRIRAAFPAVPTMRQIAKASSMSERSLRRRLAEQNVRYSDIVARVQRMRAEELLEVGDKTVKEIAGALGFANAGGFVRAYRRWTGHPPGRDRLR